MRKEIDISFIFYSQFAVFVSGKLLYEYIGMKLVNYWNIWEMNSINPNFELYLGEKLFFINSREFVCEREYID